MLDDDKAVVREMNVLSALSLVVISRVCPSAEREVWVDTFSSPLVVKSVPFIFFFFFLLSTDGGTFSPEQL